MYIVEQKAHMNEPSEKKLYYKIKLYSIIEVKDISLLTNINS